MSKCITCGHEHESIPEGETCLNCIGITHTYTEMKLIECRRFNKLDGTSLIDFINESNLVGTPHEGVIVWSANAAEQMEEWWERVKK